MNREYFTKSTRSVLMHLKELNYKLCRKGLLQRVQKSKIPFGDLKTIENDFLGKSLKAKKDSVIQKQAMEKFIEEKCDSMWKEIDILKSSLGNLTKTINNIKTDVKSRVSDKIFCMWWNRVDNIGKRFKKLYSDKDNEFYNYIYKTHNMENNAWYNIANDIKWIKDNIFVELDYISELIVGLEEGDLTHLFTEEFEKTIKRKAGMDESDGFGPDNTKKFKKDDDGNNTGDIQSGQHETNDERQVMENSHFDNISSDNEDMMINDALLNTVRDDEVGELDMDGFNDFLDKYVN